MCRARKILLAAFLVGVLISGVGTGIALVEYSSMTYEGVRVLGEDRMVTRNLDYRIEEDGGGVLLLKLNRYMTRYLSSEAELTEDPSIPVGTLRYQITYNEDLIVPELNFVPSEEEESGCMGELHLSFWQYGDGMDLILENKDKILEDIKQRRFARYDVANVSRVVILANPETLSRVETVIGW